MHLSFSLSLSWVDFVIALLIIGILSFAISFVLHHMDFGHMSSNLTLTLLASSLFL